MGWYKRMLARYTEWSKPADESGAATRPATLVIGAFPDVVVVRWASADVAESERNEVVPRP